MASPTTLNFDAEGRAVDFDVWVDHLQLFLQCDLRDGVSLFDHTSGISTAPAATADIVRYSSPSIAALSRLMLPYLDHFLSLCPTELTVNLLAEHLTAPEKSILAVGASRGDPRAPFFEGCSPVPLSPVLLLLVLSTSLALRRSRLRLLLVGGAATARARGARVVEGTVGAAVEAVEEAEGVAVEVGVVAGVGASVAAVGVVEAAAVVVEAAAAVVKVAAAVVLVEVELRSVEAMVVASASSSCVPVRPRRPSSFVSGTLGVGSLGNVAIFDLDFDAILGAMYAAIDSAEGDYYLCVPPDPGFDAAALGASEYAPPGTSKSAASGTSESAAPGAGESALSGTAPTEALHTFTLDSGASRSFFRDSTTFTPLSRPVAVSLADPSGGPVLAHSSTILPCPAAPSGLLSGLHLPSFSTNLVSGADLQDAWVDQFTPGGQRVTHCTCSRTGRHLATFTRRPGSSLYTLTTAFTPLARVVLCHTRLSFGTTALVTPPCLIFEGHERYFLLVVDDYSRYTTVFLLRRKDRGGEFSSDLQRAFCRAEGIH
ncbi:unnamed protein product [Closterium sp. NIES-53]